MAFSTFNSGQPLYGQGSSTGYTALGDRQFIKATAVTAGVRQIKTPVANVKQGDLAVQSTGAANGSVNILAGDCWIQGAAGYGFYYAYNDATITQAITALASGTRTDVIYVAVADSGSANPTVTLTYSAGGTVPANTATACYLPLASILVTGPFTASSTVADTTITDTRKKAQLADLSVSGTSSVASPTAGNLVYDTSVSAAKAYNGSAWDTLMQTTPAGALDSSGNYRYQNTVVSTAANAPLSPQVGLLWYQSDTGLFAFWNGTVWVQMGTTSIYQSVTASMVVKQGTTTLTTSSSGVYFNKIGRTVHLNFGGVLSSGGTSGQAITWNFTTSSAFPTPATSIPAPNAGIYNGAGSVYWISGTNIYAGTLTWTGSGATSILSAFVTGTGTSTLGVNPAFATASGNTFSGTITYYTNY